jgi:hypothetical protein
MTEDSCQLPQAEDNPDLVLETLVAAQYLALQMKMLTRNATFRARAATGFLAQALTEWARLVEQDVFEDDLVAAPHPQASQPDAIKIEKP